MTETIQCWKRYRVTHNTEYCYAYSVSNARDRADLIPSNRKDQRIHSAALTINQPLAESAEGIDFFGNAYRDFAINAQHRLLDVQALMDVSVRAPFWPSDSIVWNGISLARRTFDPADQEGTAFALACASYLVDSPMIPSLPEAKAWALAHLGVGKPLHQQLLAMTRAMCEEFVFDPDATSVGTPLAEVFLHKRGVCQDFAQLMIAALRSVGIPARYMSGYIVTLATGRDYADVIPLRGVVVGGGEHSLEVSVTMIPENELGAKLGQRDFKHGKPIDTANQ